MTTITKKILVIDDEDVFRTTTVKLLRKQGYITLEARNGNEGVQLTRTHLPDLVLSDVHMAGVDGLNVLRSLRDQTETAAIPVILMTGRPELMDARSSMEHGADDYLVKPFEAATLLATVQARLERQQLIEEHAQANENRLLEILAATQDLVAMVETRSGRLLYLNPAGRKMLGIAPQEDVSQLRLADFLAGEQASLATLATVNAAGQQKVWMGEDTFQSRDGRLIPISKQMLAHGSPGSAASYVSVVARDMTANKRAEQERQMMEVQLRQAQKLEAVGQLAAGIAHEINTPTQYVGDNTRFLKDAFESLTQALRAYEELFGAAKKGAVTPTLLARLEQVRTATDLDYLFEQIPAAIHETMEGVERVTKIVRAMKEFSHPGGKEKTPADLNKAIETTVTVARNEWKYVADLVLDLDPTLPLVPCFVGEFNQVILNLVVNAAHAIGDVVNQQSGTKGTITIRTRRAGDAVEIRIADTGRGIPESIRSRIFEPFFTTKEVGKGTGQGLPMVYGSVVKKHGGSVRFETQEGQGTTFIVCLPLCSKAPPGEVGAANAATLLA